MPAADTFDRFVERVRARVRRGASERRSLLWWYLWERESDVRHRLMEGADQCWRSLADDLAAFSSGIVQIQPLELRDTWDHVLGQAPDERKRMDSAAAKRRHAKAWKVQGKLPRNPVVAAEREERLSKRRADLTRWKQEAKERASCSPVTVIREPPAAPQPLSPSQMELKERLRQRDRERGIPDRAD